MFLSACTMDMQGASTAAGSKALKTVGVRLLPSGASVPCLLKLRFVAFLNSLEENSLVVDSHTDSYPYHIWTRFSNFFGLSCCHVFAKPLYFCYVFCFAGT